MALRSHWKANKGVQVLLNILLHGMGTHDAVAALTVDASGKDTLVDSRFPAEVVEQLRAYGHAVQLVDEEPGVKYLALKCEACRWRRRQPATTVAEGHGPQP
jgi:gamma-glutamyltranspeptidase